VNILTVDVSSSTQTSSLTNSITSAMIGLKISMRNTLSMTAIIHLKFDDEMECVLIVTRLGLNQNLITIASSGSICNILKGNLAETQ
jgi:hypothetical protein